MTDFLLSATRKDLSRWWQDSSALLMWLAIPLVIGGLITAMMDADGGSRPRGTLLIADLDRSFLSKAFGAAFSQGELGELILTEAVTPEEGAARIAAGGASGFLVLPAGFGAALIEREPVLLTLKTNPSQTILPGIIEDVIEVLLDAVFYAQQLLGDEIDRINELADTVDSKTIGEIAIAINDKVEAAQVHLLPPALDIRIVEQPPDEPTLPIALLFFPGIVIMAITFFANAFAGDMWVERERGTLRRLVSAPARLTDLLLGKTLAVGVATAAVATLILLAGFLYHGIPWSKLPPLLCISIVAGMALFAWFVFLQMLASTQRGANILTTVALFPLLMLGGSFFPFAAMPDALVVLGSMTPNGLVVVSMNKVLAAPGNWAVGLTDWLLLFAIAAAGLLLASWRLRTAFARAT